MSSLSIGINKPIDTNIPVVTPEGGTSMAYQDPNSPESIMKKTAEANVQAIVDQQYDTQSNPYEKKKEGFKSKLFRSNKNYSSLSKFFPFNFDFLFNIVIILIAIVLYFVPSLKRVNLIFIVIGIIGISLLLFKYFLNIMSLETYKKLLYSQGILILVGVFAGVGLMRKGSKK
jgi:hypothetical protein